MKTAILVIHSDSEDGYWNNDIGWVYDVADAQRYVNGTDGIDKDVPPAMFTKDAKWITVAFDEKD